jgi:hypothetical protein
LPPEIAKHTLMPWLLACRQQTDWNRRVCSILFGIRAIDSPNEHFIEIASELARLPGNRADSGGLRRGIGESGN